MDGMKLKRTNASSARDTRFMRVALRLAQRGFGATSPNPMVGGRAREIRRGAWPGMAPSSGRATCGN